MSNPNPSPATRFKKGQPRPPGSGAKKGTRYRPQLSLRGAFKQAFEDLGGVEGLVRWASKNPGEFYKLVARLLPTEVKADVTAAAVVRDRERERRIFEELCAQALGPPPVEAQALLVEPEKRDGPVNGRNVLERVLEDVQGR
jgi:hypothetical protein